MATTPDFIDYVKDQVDEAGFVRYKKMFGEYLVYVNDKPILLVCDNTVYVNQHACLQALMQDADKGYPYPGAKEHYILDIENKSHAIRVMRQLEEATPVPKPKKKKVKT